MVRDELLGNESFHEFVQQVGIELASLEPDVSQREDSLVKEKESLETQCQGWLQSLSMPTTGIAVRTAVQELFEKADVRIREIASELHALKNSTQLRKAAIDPEQIADCLQQLSDILASGKPAAANLMLAQHIEAIYCDSQGKVTIRTCKLGALTGAIDLIPRTDAPAFGSSGPSGAKVYAGEPRRGTRRDVEDAFDDDDFRDDANDFAANPDRFGGLGPEWFYEDVFQVPRRLSWAEAHAREVAEFRLKSKVSMALTSQHFGKTIPTIRAALRYAKENHGLDAFGTGISMSTRSNWSRENASQVSAFFEQASATMKAAVTHFGKTEPTIRKALDFARSSSDENLENGAGESTVE